MKPEIKQFVESYRNKPKIEFSISDFKNTYGNISFNKLLKHHNHDIWKKCSCGNEEDLRMTWHCSNCGKELFKPKN
ncbi:hypothetical protein [Chryseobacterium oncorhynchi]|uniref:Uncharacterized protein n=1 Tax=Chryseobacterium oncorhynchi TaxID=741074 RepID=A0A316X2U8_9FLAO|nr:hypothetical protein [Chryseobacterium oncorhynchi]PWN67629.1 hypothetical protein C1638_003290 [Chryseobacterium oncorhynchi]